MQFHANPFIIYFLEAVEDDIVVIIFCSSLICSIMVAFFVLFYFLGFFFLNI